MNITLPSNSAPATGGNRQISVDLALSGLPESGSFTAKVLFSSGDTVHLKTTDGALIKARLEGGVQLAEGSTIQLEAVEKGANTLLLRVVQDGAQNGAPRPALSESALLALAEQLQTPGLTAQQRIDLIVRSLFGSAQAVGAEQATQAGQTPAAPPIDPEAQMGRMLTELLSLLAEAGSGSTTVSTAAPTAQSTATTTLAPAEAANQATSAASTTPPATTGQGDALRIFTSVLYTVLGGQEQTAAQPPPTALPAAMTNESLPAQAQQPTPPPALGQSSPVSLPLGEVAPQAPESAAANTGNVQPNPPNAATAGGAQATPNTVSPVPADQTGQPGGSAQPVAAEITAQIKQLPSAAEVPPQKLEALLETAQNIMAELRPNPQAPLTAETLQQFTDRLFARAGETAPAAAQLLKKAVNELELRLSFLEEAIERSQLSQKNELLGQTQRLLNHAESLRQTERFYCLQIPIQFEQEQQTAELYVYRRERSGGKIDPANTTILLALDTQHLGRVETAIQIKNREISLRMETSRAEAVPFLQKRGNTLYGLLAQAGYKLTSTAFLPLKEKTSVENAETTLRNYHQGFNHKVDFRI